MNISLHPMNSIMGMEIMALAHMQYGLHQIMNLHFIINLFQSYQLNKHQSYKDTHRLPFANPLIQSGSKGREDDMLTLLVY